MDRNIILKEIEDNFNCVIQWAKCFDYERAVNLNIRRTLIEDNGLTEFHNVKTKTVLVLGPDYDDRLDEITKHLTLMASEDSTF